MSAVAVTAGVVIRRAELSDIPRIVDLGREFLRSSSYAEHLRENSTQMTETAVWLMESAHGALFVAEREDRVVGMIGLACITQPLDGSRTVAELFLFVEPEARGTSAFIRLEKRAVAWAKEQGASAIDLIAPSRVVEELYERMGYAPVERIYRKRV